MKYSFEIEGASHAEKITATVRGLPAGFTADTDRLTALLARRAPGKNPWSTARKEADLPVVTYRTASDGTTAVTFTFYNEDAHPADYAQKNGSFLPRPSHADYPAYVASHGKEDLSGGGRYSGRMTVALCAVGSVALQLLAEKGVSVGAHLASVGNVSDRPFSPTSLTAEELFLPASRPIPVLDDGIACKIADLLTALHAEGDSVGAAVECAVLGLPVGFGYRTDVSPLAESLESEISSAVFGIPGVRGVSFGDGFALASRRGSEANDPYILTPSGIRTASNHGGGVLGGMSTGMPLILSAAFKPTPSVALPQKTVDLIAKKEAVLTVSGRHDPCIALRAVPAVESAVAIALLRFL